MAGVVPSVASTKETTNYARLCRLLVDICSQALRDTFDGIHAPENLHTVLASHPVCSTLQTLFKGKKKILNPGQWCKLYPAIASSVSSATFDITLLMVLLRNICSLRPPATGWGNLPAEDDKSLEADIVRIKYFRNTVYALVGQASVNDATFNTHWQNIREVLVRLGGAKYGDAIDTLKTECMDPVIEEHYRELLQQWKKDEYVIKEQLHEMGEDIKYIKEALRVALNKHGEEEVRPEMMHPDKNHREGLLEMHLSTSGQESNKINTKEKYGNSSLNEANQHYQDPRYRTDPQTGHQLTIQSNVGLAGKESKHVSSMSSEHRRQPGSERVTDAQATGSRAGTAGGAQPVRLLYKPQNSATIKKVTSKSGSSASDLKDHSAAKTKPKCPSPGLRRWTSAERKDQPPVTSSKDDHHDEISRERRLLEESTKAAAICELCQLQGTIICKNCPRIVCRHCIVIYETDLCEVTKGQHTFTELPDNKMPQKTSVDSKTDSSQGSANTNEACGNGGTNWPCSRCTYLNYPEHRICLVCGATRGIDVVESAKPGSRVCWNCTLHNEETAVECIACHNPLFKSETTV